MTRKSLGECADVLISGVDKKTLPDEQPVRLCNYTDVYYNWAVTSEMYDGLMRASAKPNEIDKFKLAKGQVALTKDSETREDIGIPSYIASDFDDVILGYHCALIKPDETLLSGKFLNALLHAKYVKLFFSNNAGGSGQRYYLSDKNIKDLPLFLPDVSIQRRIGGFLSSIDRLIQLSRKRIENLEKLAKEIYDYWFVQFDFPDKHGRPYKSSGGKMVYNEQLKREIPEGWDVRPLPLIVEYLFGYPFDSKLFNACGDGVPIVRIRNVADGFTNDFSVEKPAKEYLIRNGDFLIGMDGYFNMNLWVGGDAYLVQRACRLTAKDPRLQGYLRRFIYPIIRQLETKLQGATVAHLGKSHLDVIQVAIPNGATSALSMLNKCDAAIVKAGVEIRKLIQLREFLLPLLMNGQAKMGG